MSAGFKIYSQSDEDGIIQEIFKRIKTSNKLFLEIGVGDGSENNTVWLLISGWKGIWIESDRKNFLNCLEFSEEIEKTGKSNSLKIFQNEVKANKEFTYALNSLKELGMIDCQIDLLSIDIDSQDISVCEMVLKYLRPRVIVIEYNAKFPPPISISVSKSMAKWNSDDYYGASLSYIATKLQDYLLVGTSITGSNAFFVHQDYRPCFMEIGDINTLYSPLRFYLSRCKKIPKAMPLKWISNET
jgi:hypothetical protein